MDFFDKIIELCTRNINVKHPKPIGDQIVLIFDIDNCLYRSKELEDDELNFIKNGFLRLSNYDESFWLAELPKYNLYREMFSSFLNMDLFDFSETFERPNLEKYLQPDLELRNLLKKIKFRLFCFTNGCKHRAKHILTYLQLDDIFEGVICSDIESKEFLAKPNPETYKFVEKYLGVEDVKKIYFFDDSYRNIEGAVAAGWNAIHIKNDVKEEIKKLSLELPLFDS